MLAPGHPKAALVSQVTALLHEDKPIEAAQVFLASLGLTTAVKSIESAHVSLNTLLHWLLENDGYEEAANLLWGNALFDPRPESTQRIWRNYETEPLILLMGAASMSKSYSVGVRVLLEWIRDPEYTTIKVLGPSEQHLEDNLFSHLVGLHRQSKLPLPGEISQLFIGLDPKTRKSSIAGVIIPPGRKAGRLQGVKRIPRKKPHPVFGPLSRLIIFLDEVALIPKAVFKDVDNLMSQTDGIHGLKIIGAFNPVDQHDEVGIRTEPIDGWDQFDPDKSFEWKSKRGWKVVRLDAMQCENVAQGKTLFPGLQTKEGLDILIQNAGGTDSPGYWSMARACFPPSGVNFSVIPQGLLNSIKGEFLFIDRPVSVGACDLALEGGDVAVFGKGLYGLATGIKYPPTTAHPNGRLAYFLDPQGMPVARYALQLDNLFKLPKGDTFKMFTQLMELCKLTGIKPEHFCCDRTGHGAGVHDMLKAMWSPAVLGVNYSESATETKITEQDTKNCKEEYQYVTSELWFAAKKWIEFEYFRISPGVEVGDLFPQLTQRLFKLGRLNRVESKKEYRSRGMKSPDEADTVTLLVHVVRVTERVVIGMIPTDMHQPGDSWGGEAFVDSTNLTDSLD